MMSTVQHTFWAPGKLLLFGEHSAVFGYPAVGSALDRGLSVAISPAERMTLTIGDAKSPRDSTTEEAPTRFGEFFLQHAPHLPPSRLDIVSDLPVSSGFGSSAALCTALARWSLTAEQPNLNDEAARGVTDRPEQWHRAVWRRAHELEMFFHGTPSGIDTGLAALGGVQAFHFDAEHRGELPLAEPLPGELPPLVVGSIPRRRSTRDLVAMVRRRQEEEPASTDEILSQLGSLAEDAIAHLSRPPVVVEALGRTASAAQELLSRLGVSSAALDRILQAGSDAGALGGKLSGAGDGGAFYLVCSTKEAAENVHAAIVEHLPPEGSSFVL